MEKIGKVGELNKEISDYWMFWRVISKHPTLLAEENKISYTDIQILYSVIQMNEDFNQALDSYQEQKWEKK